MTYNKLRWSILSILRRLLLPYLTQVPDMKSAVRATRGKDGLVVGGPLNLQRQQETRVTDRYVYIHARKSEKGEESLGMRTHTHT